MKIKLFLLLLLISTSVMANLNCKKAVEKCSDTITDSKLIYRCIADLDYDCDDKIDFYLSNQVAQLKNKLETSLKSLEEVKPTSGKCQDGMKWGYLRQPKNNNVYSQIMNTSMIIRLERLYGEFNSKDKCEEARILEDEKFETSSECHTRYLGQKKSIDVFEAIAMNNSSKLTLKFKNEIKCEQSVKNGIIYPDGNQKIDLGSKGSKRSNRFIQGCTKKTLVICEEHKQGEQILDKIF